MKFFAISIVTLFLTTFTTFNVQASSRGVDGLIIGAGSGALLGQAIGRDTESTLIGTAIGGVIGYAIGNEHRGYRHRPQHYRQDVEYRPHRYQKRSKVIHYHDNRSYHYPRHKKSYRGENYGRPFHKKHFREKRHYRSDSYECRKRVKVKTRHGYTKRIITTTCYDDRPRYYRYR